MNNYLPVVIEAKYIDGYQIEVEFSNSERRLADCEKWLNGEIFQPLRDQEYFQKFFVDGWTIAWPNGADIAPETLYEEGQVLASAGLTFNGIEALAGRGVTTSG